MGGVGGAGDGCRAGGVDGCGGALKEAGDEGLVGRDIVVLPRRARTSASAMPADGRDFKVDKLWNEMSGAPRT